MNIFCAPISPLNKLLKHFSPCFSNKQMDMFCHAQVYNLIAEGTIEENVYSILEQKLFEIAKTIGKIDNVTGEVTEDFRSEILGFLGSSLNYNDLYKEALINKNYTRTGEEIAEALRQAKESSNALRQLAQDLKTFNLENYIELKGKYTLEDLKLFCEKAILRLGGSFVPSGEIVSIVVPPALKKYAGISSHYENVTFSRKIAIRKKGIDLMGVGHPLVDALISHYNGDAISGDILISKNNGIPDIFSARYLFTMDFEDSTKKELYKEFVLSGNQVKSDVELLMQQEWKEDRTVTNLKEMDEQISIRVRNFEAQLRSECEGVLSVRTKCVGVMYLHR